MSVVPGTITENTPTSANYQLSVNENGDTILTLSNGYNYKFMLQVPVIGALTEGNSSGTLPNGWSYNITFYSNEPMETISAPGSVSDYYWLYLKAEFMGVSATQPLVLDATTSPNRPSFPDLVYLTSILQVTNYNPNGYNILISQVVPWYIAAQEAIANIPSNISNWFANVGVAIAQNGRNTDQWLTNNLMKPVSNAGHAAWNGIVWFWNGFIWVLGQIWKVLYAIGYFIIEAWPLWVLLAFLILIVEVKKWNQNRVIKKSLKKQKMSQDLKEEHELRLRQQEEEHLRRIRESMKKETA